MSKDSFLCTRKYDIIIKKRKNQALSGQGLPVEPVEACRPSEATTPQGVARGQKAAVEAGSSRYNL